MVGEASVDDIEQIAGVHLASWRRAYSGIYPQDFIDDNSIAILMEYWRPLFEKPHFSYANVVARIGGNIVGVCALLNAEESAEVDRFHEDARFHGRGVGRAMFEHLVQVARAAQQPELFAYVVERNAEGVAFWEHMGFAWNPDHPLANHPCKHPRIAHVNMLRLTRRV
jgi:GNAT superfamily N-acetyltransferase